MGASYPKLGGTPFNANYVQEVVAAGSSDYGICGVAAVNASRAILAYFDGGALFIKSIESYGHCGLTAGTPIEVEGIGGGSVEALAPACVSLVLGADGRIYGVSRYYEDDPVTSATKAYLDTFAIDHPDDESAMAPRVIATKRVTWTTTNGPNDITLAAYRDGSFHVSYTDFGGGGEKLWKTGDLVSLESDSDYDGVNVKMYAHNLESYILESATVGKKYVSAYDAGDNVDNVFACPLAIGVSTPYGLAIMGWEDGAPSRHGFAIPFGYSGFASTLSADDTLPGLFLEYGFQNFTGVYIGGACWSFGSQLGPAVDGIVALRWGGWDVVTSSVSPPASVPGGTIPWHGAYTDDATLWGDAFFRRPRRIPYNNNDERHSDLWIGLLHGDSLGCKQL